MTRISRLGAVVAIAAAVACAGCSVIPVSGPHAVNEAGGGDPLSKPFQRMIAIAPQKNWGPEQIIRGLQAAMAAYPDDPAILPTYLTPEALAKWSASGPVTVIEDGFEVVPPSPRDGTEAVQKVTLKARWVASIKEDDSYVPTAGGWSRSFELVKDKQGGYRVSDLPSGLLLTNSDVARAYRATNLYYLNGNTQDRLVVDRVRLRLKPTETFAQTILKRLLEPPTSALAGGAVTTSFPPGTKIESITYGDERVLINLSGPLDPLDLTGENSLMAQIRYSLNKNEVAKGRSIEVLVDGEAYSIDRPNSDERWLDDSGDTAYYVSKGAVHLMGKDGPAGAVPGPAGEQREGYSDFALSKESNALIAARTSTGISVAGLTREGQWQEVIQGTDLTAPTWHRDGSLWTYDRKNGFLLRYDPAGGRGPERVAPPKELKGLDVTRLRIARDGVRVAVTTGKNTVQICALTTAAGGLMLGNLQLLTTTEEGDEIRDVAWGDDEHLLVLVDSKAGQILNQINVGDGESVGVPLKDRLKSVAALGDRVLAASDDGSKVIELNQDRQTWNVKIEPDAEAPLFPLG
ncbi:LpqB family beta-propeller domain-containing protein [Nonomuraea sp. M3C6]|uniref:LpqB family beta-propeller domain-containing protein n=1 Tax=Nonomuraea marmarensis TaxID=3351344 RepID=A0ABW7A8B3_9ACTN